jgi:parallel beta-helix repeat protein
MLQWSKIPTATSFNIYGRTAQGETLLTNIPNSFGAAFPNWIDDGSLTPDGSTTPPLVSSVDILPCVIEGNEAWRNVSTGIFLYGAGGCKVRGNHSHHNGLHGIGLINNSNNNTVEFNVCHNNSRGNRTANGIQLDRFGAGTAGSSNNIVQNNRCFRNEDSGITIYSGSNNCIIRRNICYKNGDHGIDVSNASNCHVINNMAYLNDASGMQAEGTSQGIRMYNNVSMDNGINSTRTSSNYRFDPVTISDVEFDYNLSYLTVPAMSQVGDPGLTNSEIVWGTTNYSTLASFRSAVSSQMIHGIAADPQFADIPSSNFRLNAASPARGLALAVAPDFSSTDFFGFTTGSSPTAGPIE